MMHVADPKQGYGKGVGLHGGRAGHGMGAAPGASRR